jgi:CheY-like chemotaxis protein
MAFSFDDITERVQDRDALREAAEMLERRVAERTTALQAEIAERREVEACCAQPRPRPNMPIVTRRALAAARRRPAATAERGAPVRFGAGRAPPRRAQSGAGAANRRGARSVEDLLEALFEISRLDAGAITPVWSAIELEQMLAALRIEFAAVARAEGLSLDIPVTDVWVRSDIRLLRRICKISVQRDPLYRAGQVSITVRSKMAPRASLCATPGRALPMKIRKRSSRNSAVWNRPSAFRQGFGAGHCPRQHDAGPPAGCQIDAGQGSAFSVLVPLAEAHPARAVILRPAMRGTTGTQSLLVIDNDPAILAGMAALLRNWGHKVATATGPHDKERRACRGHRRDHCRLSSGR